MSSCNLYNQIKDRQFEIFSYKSHFKVDFALLKTLGPCKPRQPKHNDVLDLNSKWNDCSHSYFSTVSYVSSWFLLFSFILTLPPKVFPNIVISDFCPTVFSPKVIRFWFEEPNRKSSSRKYHSVYNLCQLSIQNYTCTQFVSVSLQKMTEKKKTSVQCY